MTLLFLAILTLSNICLLGIGVHSYVKANRAVKRTSDILSDLFIPKVEGQSSVMGAAVQEWAETISQRIGAHTQAAIKGSIGGTMKGVNAALEQEAIAENPALGLVEMLPKSLKKNQLAQVGLMSIINRFMQGSGSGGPGGPGSSNNGQGQTKFML